MAYSAPGAPRQDDPQLAVLSARIRSNPQIMQLLRSGQSVGGVNTGSTQAEYYIRTHPELGITLPPGYTLQPDGSLYYAANESRPPQHWYSDPATIGPIAVAAAGGGFGAFGGPFAAAPAASSAPGVLPSSSIGGLHTAVPAAVSSQGVSAGVGAVAGGGAATGGPLASLTSGAKRFFSDPRNIARTAGAVVPLFSGAFGGGGDNPYDANSPLMQGVLEDMAAARQRYQQAQPVYDALVNMAYGRTPTRYRGAAPQGYPSGGDAAPAGPYQYTAPRFG